ncbi:helix-turn-helix domain-containing protein [Streptomyces sp. NPDC051555]|uniref:helix-turn-helix domain-containing protein n=1 Tax=Streptomyces sp. NPDC051555 TaxID=3365657 RepID=UPI00378BB7EA
MSDGISAVTIAAHDPPVLAPWAWERPDVREALRARDVGALLRAVQKFSGASQGRIAGAIGMTQARVSEIMRDRREVARLDVYERIADGLSMPDDARRLLGLAAARGRRDGGAGFDLSVYPEVVRVYETQAAAREEIQRHARTATELDVLAVRGLGLIGLNDSLLRGHLARAGVRVRVLLLDPDASVVEQRAAEIGESPRSLAAGIRLSEDRLRELSGVCDVQVYRYASLPTWRLIRADDVMFVGAFDAGWEGHESATYKVAATPSGPLFRGHRRMVEAMIAGAQRTV